MIRTQCESSLDLGIVRMKQNMCYANMWHKSSWFHGCSTIHHKSHNRTWSRNSPSLCFFHFRSTAGIGSVGLESSTVTFILFFPRTTPLKIRILKHQQRQNGPAVVTLKAHYAFGSVKAYGFNNDGAWRRQFLDIAATISFVAGAMDSLQNTYIICRISWYM